MTRNPASTPQSWSDPSTGERVIRPIPSRQPVQGGYVPEGGLRPEPPTGASGVQDHQQPPMGCICPGDATPFCKNPLCPRKAPG